MTDLSMDRPAWRTWPHWDPRVVQGADVRSVAIAVAGGVAFDLGVRSGVASVGGLLAVVVAASGLLASARLQTAASRWCLAAAVAFAPFLELRISPWLVPLDVLAIGGLLGLSGMLARDGRLADLSVALLASRVVLALVHGVRAAGFLVEPFRVVVAGGDRTRRLRTASRVLRAAVVAVPVLVVLGALLASADAVFASMLRIDISIPDNVVAHVVLVVLGALALAGVLRLASAAPSGPLPAPPWRLDTLEWTIVLGSVVGLFAVFAGVQVVAAAGGGRHVLETEGLTYAEYARSGYFQLLAVAALTGLVLGILNAVADRSTASARRWFTALAELTVGLTGVVLGVALRRLATYEDAYGWTMLRLVAKVGAVWIGLVLVLLALRVLGVGRDRAWFVPAAVGAGLALLLALNAVNPEAAVVRHNLDRASAGLPVDPAYLTELSADAVPEVINGLHVLPEEQQANVLRDLCRRTDGRRGLLSWNRAEARARASLAGC